MTVIFSGPLLTDEERRTRLYEGHVFLYPARPESLALIEFARELIGDAFGGLDPETAQYELPVEKFAAILAELKPKFIHHPRAKELLRALLLSFGCDADRTYFDVPRMRSSTSDDYLTTGIAYAFHPHRDTWYSAPLSQVNWWIPIFEVVPENVMTFHPRYWNTPVKNGSARYDYYEWNRISRFNAAQHIGTDTREQPKPEEPIELEPRVTVVPEPGGILIFSGNQLHSSVPNTSGRTRFSIDFRTVNLDDVIARHEAPNVDCACTGTTLRDFLRVSDLERMPEDVALSYEGKG
ncbi:phytanoyl-CoA dioxygenase family protein [Microbispora hainanensis]|uniref:Phytanoyl-CoA dioxygenase family protein n=1 Tax=Microbispora hainanensis TaxID=568844 RepID=A0A544YTW5_9ACTN|nr:phytanoyl-CoA dioxygenase family protein [Microbispora hainanensis]TQS20203.1 phytanoyl-CoA dioxygenase family protein [Microbispora hainanensis]